MPSRRKMLRLVLSHAGMAATGLGLIASGAVVARPVAVEAQGDCAPADGLVVIPGPDGGPVILRSGPSYDQPAVTSLAPYEQAQPSDDPGVRTGDDTPAMALFNLADDPSEQHNVAAKHPDVVARLKERYDKMVEELAAARR